MTPRRRSGQSQPVRHTSSRSVKLPSRNWEAPSHTGSAATLALLKSLYSSLYNKSEERYSWWTKLNRTKCFTWTPLGLYGEEDKKLIIGGADQLMARAAQVASFTRGVPTAGDSSKLMRITYGD